VSTFDKSILDEELAGEVEYLSLVDRVRWLDGAENGEETCKEAAQVLRELRDLLLESKLWTKDADARVLGSSLLECLMIQHTHQVSPEKFVQLDLMSSLEGAPELGGQEQHLQRGNLLAANVLDEAVRVLVALRTDPRAEDLLKRITDKTRTCGSPPPGQSYHVHCDGITGTGAYGGPCWAKGPEHLNQEAANTAARNLGWLVTDEQDLCPSCQKNSDSEPEDLDLDRELSLAEAAAGLTLEPRGK
jgi:hypothetical protein